MPDPAFTSPYADPNITYRNLTHVDITPAPAYNDNLSNLAGVSVYDPAGRETSGFSHVDAPAQAPNYWKPGRDLYANGGAVGQTFFNKA